MAFNLIPPGKKSNKGKNRIGTIALKKIREPKKIIYLGIFILGVILVLVFYGLVRIYQSSLEEKIDEIEEQTKTLDEEKRALQEKSEVTDFQTKLTILDNLVEEHTYWTDFFSFLEGITLPEVQFVKFNSDIKSHSLILEGKTVSFRKIAEQVIALKNHEFVKELKLSSVRISDEGIGFNLKIKVLPEAWQEDKSS